MGWDTGSFVPHTNHIFETLAEEALSRLGFISDCLGAVKGSPWVTGAWNCPLDQAEVG